MPALTKTQINHFSERLHAAARQRKKAMLEQSKYMLPAFDPVKAKIEAIVKGEVELNVDKLSKALGPLKITLDEAYDDPKDVCEFHTKRKELESLIRDRYNNANTPEGAWCNLLDKHIARLLDDFVLGKIDTGNVQKTLDSIETWKPRGYWPLLRAPE